VIFSNCVSNGHVKNQLLLEFTLRAVHKRRLQAGGREIGRLHFLSKFYGQEEVQPVRTYCRQEGGVEVNFSGFCDFVRTSFMDGSNSFVCSLKSWVKNMKRSQ